MNVPTLTVWASVQRRSARKQLIAAAENTGDDKRLLRPLRASRRIASLTPASYTKRSNRRQRGGLQYQKRTRLEIHQRKHPAILKFGTYSYGAQQRNPREGHCPAVLLLAGLATQCLDHYNARNWWCTSGSICQLYCRSKPPWGTWDTMVSCISYPTSFQPANFRCVGSCPSESQSAASRSSS